MPELLHTFSFAFSVTGPIIVILVLGVVLSRSGMITDAFVESGSKLAFNVLLPTLLFVSISKADFAVTANINLIGVGLLGTLGLYLLFEIFAHTTVQPREERGIVVQGAYRSNMGIVGLAYCVNAYGDTGLAAASLYLGLVTILFNVLAVITLNRSLDKHASLSGVFRSVASNPLIISILLALPVARWQLEIPGVLLKSAEYFSQMTLPLALLITGASLNLKALRYESRNALTASFGKLVLVPVAMTSAGYLVGLQAMELGIVFLMTSAPTATASYVMVRAMGGNAALAANIIVVTTLGSLFFVSLGSAWLRAHGLI